MRIRIRNFIKVNMKKSKLYHAVFQNSYIIPTIHISSRVFMNVSSYHSFLLYHKIYKCVFQKWLSCTLLKTLESTSSHEYERKKNMTHDKFENFFHW